MSVPSFAPVLAFLGIIANIAVDIVASHTNWFVVGDSPQSSYSHNVTITPSNWVFTMWATVYIWQFILLSYSLVVSYCHCRNTDKSTSSRDHRHSASESKSNIIFTTSFWLAYFWASIFNCVWIILLVNGQMSLSAFFATITTLLLYVVCYTSHKYLMFDLPLSLTIDHENFPKHNISTKGFKESVSTRPLQLAFKYDHVGGSGSSGSGACPSTRSIDINNTTDQTPLIVGMVNIINALCFSFCRLLIFVEYNFVCVFLFFLFFFALFCCLKILIFSIFYEYTKSGSYCKYV